MSTRAYCQLPRSSADVPHLAAEIESHGKWESEKPTTAAPAPKVNGGTSAWVVKSRSVTEVTVRSLITGSNKNRPD